MHVMCDTYSYAMRTTISINDHLLEQAKSRASERGITLGTLVEEALRRELMANRSLSARITLPVFGGGGGVRPGVDINSNRSVQEILDSDLPLSRLR